MELVQYKDVARGLPEICWTATEVAATRVISDTIASGVPGSRIIQASGRSFAH